MPFRKSDAQCAGLGQPIPLYALLGMRERLAQEFEDMLLGERVAARFARNFPSTDALNKYLREHPNADARGHKVVRPQDKSDEQKSLDDLKSRVRHEKRQRKKQVPPEAA